MKLKKVVLGESASAALFKAADGALTKESVDSLVSTVETLMNKKIKQIAIALKKENVSAVASFKKKFAAENNKKLSKYVNYVVKEWLKKNRPAIRDVIEAKQNKEIVDRLKTSLSEMRVSAGTNTSKVVTKLSESIEQLTGKLNAAQSKLVTKESSNNKLKRLVVIERLGRDMTKLQVEKFASLANSIKAGSIEAFAAKAKKLKESILSKKDTPAAKPKQQLAESVLSRAVSIV